MPASASRCCSGGLSPVLTSTIGTSLSIAFGSLRRERQSWSASQSFNPCCSKTRENRSDRSSLGIAAPSWARTSRRPSSVTASPRIRATRGSATAISTLLCDRIEAGSIRAVSSRDSAKGVTADFRLSSRTCPSAAAKTSVSPPSRATRSRAPATIRSTASSSRVGSWWNNARRRTPAETAVSTAYSAVL